MSADFVEVDNVFTEPISALTVKQVKKTLGIDYINTPNKQVFVSGDADVPFEIIDDSNGTVLEKGQTNSRGQMLVVCSYVSKTLKVVALSLLCVINIFAQQTTQVNVQQQTLTATAPIVKNGNVLSLNFSQLPDFWRVNRGATGAVPDGANDVTKKIGHLSDIYVGADAQMTVGHGAGNVASNTTVGNFALESNTTGNYNTANGVTALFFNTTGSENTANGGNALFSNTTGNYNTATGVNALFSNTTGNYNTVNGVSALYNNTTGRDNTANGVNALFSNTTGGRNTANGSSSLYSNTTGSDNTTIGLTSLFSNTTGRENTANGVNALFSNTIGNYNTANGVGALYNNTTGSENTANGVTALFSNTIGNQNTAIGETSLFYNTQNSKNTAMGVESFNDSQVLSTSATLTASNSTRVTISPALTGGWVVGDHVFIELDPPFSSSISGFYEGSYKIVNATTLEVLKPNTVLGTTGTVNTVEVRQGRKIDNATALGYNAEPTASNQVVLGDVNVTQVVSTGTFFGAGFTVASDKRIKSEIKDLTPEMITALKSIKPKLYKNANSGNVEMGVIAQDIPAVLRPYLVTITPMVYSKVKSAELKLLMAKKLGYTTVANYTKAVEANRLALLANPTDARLLAEKERLTITNDTAYLTDFYSVDYAKLAAMVALVK